MNAKIGGSVVETLRRTRGMLARLRRGAATVLFLAAMLLPALAVQAQGARQLVPGALTTKRLERLMSAYVRPTNAEASAIDRVHEQYLERFRLELEPEIAKLSNSMSGGMPSRAEFDRFMRDLDRLSARIAVADGAFLDACSGLVAEERRGGLQRIREARERQRILAGFGAMGGMMFGSSLSFVDMADMLARPEFLGSVPEDQRGRFDALMRSEEPRVLAQARAYSGELRDGMGRFFDAMTRSFDPANPAGEEAQRAFREEIAAVGKELRRLVRQNYEGNRAAAAQLEGMLPERQLLDFRERLVLRTFGALSASFMYGGEADVEAVGRRVQRDAALSAATKSAIDAVVLAWKREWVATLEAGIASLAREDAVSAPPMGGMDGTDSPAAVAVAKLATERAALARTALEKIWTLLGERASEFVARVDRIAPDGTTQEVAYQQLPEAQAEPGQAEFEAATVRTDALSMGGTIEALGARTVLLVLSAVATPGVDQALVEALVEEWVKTDWNVNVVPITEEMQKIAGSRYVQQPDGQWSPDAAAVTRLGERRRAAAAAALEADRRLVATLSGALGLGADDPAPVLLRLERMNLLLNRGSGVSDLAFPLPPAQLLRHAAIDEATARAVAIAMVAGLRPIADDLPAMVASRLERMARIGVVELAFSTRDQQAVESSSREYMQLLQEGQREDSEFAQRFARIYDDACTAVVADEGMRTELRRSRLRSTYPSVYRVSDSALREFAAAARLDGLTDDERARLEAMRAEYEGVYEALSEQMILPGFDVVPGDGSPESWQDYARRAEEVEKRRFQRNERTQKARNELRRLLGDERAARIPGLSRDEDAAASRGRQPFNPFDQTADD